MCSFNGNREEFFNHLTSVHFKQLAKNADRIFMEVDESTEDWRLKSIDEICELINENGFKARLGESGKYYCGQSFKHTYYFRTYTCGVRSGYNCKACMKLDLKVRGLPKGWLVNDKQGAPTQKGCRGKFHCGRRNLSENLDKKHIDTYCDPRHGVQCDNCSNADWNGYYKGLL